VRLAYAKNNEKHLQAYLDEFAFRYNRRKTAGVGRIAARVIEQLIVQEPLTMRELIDDTKPCRGFASAQSATRAKGIATQRGRTRVLVMMLRR
jgi:hypothetical protein